jgi:DNA-binding CsgD family transcriptional regulator
MERPVPLTPRETQVLQQVLLGKTNKQIALALDISERTVEYHLKNIYAKCGVSSRIELVLKLGNATGRTGSTSLGASTVEIGASLRENGSRDSSIVDDLASIAKEPEMKRRWTFYGLAGLLFGAAYWHYFSLTARLFNQLGTAGRETAEGWLLILALLTDFGVWLIPAVLPALIESRRSPSVRLSVLAVVTVWLGAVLGYYLNYLATLAFVGLPHMEYLLLFGQRTASFWEAWPKVLMKLIVVNYLKWTLVGSVISAIAGLITGSVFHVLLKAPSRGAGLPAA